LSLILPIGLSFHTFQSLSYVIEVYWGNYKAEHHFGIYALYVMFYPQLVAGPIERPGNLLRQFYEEHTYDDQRVMDGLKLMAWGLFKKMVIADRLAILVDQVYNNPTQYTGIPLIAACLLFAYQVYCDFSGYSDIAIGAAQVMGFRLVDNFNKPFFYATSTGDLWRRWHMSLMNWFRDYVYAPLARNRKGKWRRYFNIFFVFALSGLWHGPKWGLILWGAMNGFYIIFSAWTRDLRKRLVHWVSLDRFSAFRKVLQSAFTFLLFCAGAPLFRAENLSDAYYTLTHLGAGLGSAAGVQMSLRSLYSLNLGKYELIVALVSIGFMEFIQKIETRGGMRHLLSEKPIWFRWPVYYILLLSLIFLGVYNDQAFIYFQF
jgi:D-alanyl-lipoteichoic acid acyltransferase DltB (MBOAT superfamily)